MKAAKIQTPKTEFPAAIGKPAGQALEGAGYSSLKQLTRVTQAELGQLHGMGPKALGILGKTLKAKGMSFAKISQSEAKQAAATASVDQFMKKLKHPFKPEVEMLRKIIKGVNKDIAEEIKWNAPSFSYKGEYLVTFNLWEKERIHLVFHNPHVSRVKSKLMEGQYKDRRMAYFLNMKDIKTKRPALEKALKDLIKLQK